MVTKRTDVIDKILKTGMMVYLWLMLGTKRSFLAGAALYSCQELGSLSHAQGWDYLTRFYIREALVLTINLTVNLYSSFTFYPNLTLLFP